MGRSRTMCAEGGRGSATMLRYVASGLLATLAFSGPALAQSQSKEQQTCINYLNNGMAKISSTQLKAVAKCANDYAKDKGVTNPESCAQTSTKVSAARTKIEAGETAKCPTPPTLGPTLAATVANEAANSPLYFMAGLFGSLETNLVKCSDAPEDDGCKCQSTVIKTSSKLWNFYAKGFNKCKKTGLKAEGAEQIVDNPGLGACLVDPATFDPKAKHAKLLEKAKTAVAKGCSSMVTNPLPYSFECANKTGDALATCLDERARCYVCVMISYVDGMNLYDECDTFDDGAGNGSCFGE